MGTSSERIFNGSGKGYLPAGTIGNRTHILSERLKAGTEFKRLKKGHRPAPMPPTWTHILSYKPLNEPMVYEGLADGRALHALYCMVYCAAKLISVIKLDGIEC